MALAARAEMARVTDSIAELLHVLLAKRLTSAEIYGKYIIAFPVWTAFLF